jgi:hypothetical protein
MSWNRGVELHGHPLALRLAREELEGSPDQWRSVTVAGHHDGALVGVVVLTVTSEGFLIDNVAVHPGRRGTGLAGRCCSSRRPRHGARRSTPSTCTPTSR